MPTCSHGKTGHREDCPTGGTCRNCFLRWTTPGWPTCAPCFFRPGFWRPRWSDDTPEDVWWARIRVRYPQLNDEPPTSLRRAA